jgi:hypothetical protein
LIDQQKIRSDLPADAGPNGNAQSIARNWILLIMAGVFAWGIYHAIGVYLAPERTVDKPAADTPANADAQAKTDVDAVQAVVDKELKPTGTAEIQAESDVPSDSRGIKSLIVAGCVAAFLVFWSLLLWLRSRR